jgi:hypothetical protein
MRPTAYRATLAFGLTSIFAAATGAGQEHQHPPSLPTTQAAAATPLYDNLGTLHHAITTKSPVAQQYFDQGLRLTYGFNHDEAVKSFKEGVRQAKYQPADGFVGRAAGLPGSQAGPEIRL